MNSTNLINFKKKLLEINNDIKQRIIDTDLLLGIYSAFDNSSYNSIQEMAEMAFCVSRKRFDEIVVEGKKMTNNERKNIINYLDKKINWLQIESVVNQHILNTVEILGIDAYKYLGISIRTQQRYLKNIAKK